MQGSAAVPAWEELDALWAARKGEAEQAFDALAVELGQERFVVKATHLPVLHHSIGLGLGLRPRTCLSSIICTNNHCGDAAAAVGGQDVLVVAHGGDFKIFEKALPRPKTPAWDAPTAL
jgi:hypothetical protein